MTGATFPTMAEMVDEARAHGQPTGYHGDAPDAIIIYSTHRDADILERSNYAALTALAGEIGSVERFGHWAVGWVDYLIIDPADLHPGHFHIIERLRQAVAGLEDYPVIDDEAYSELETDEAWDSVEAAIRDRVRSAAYDLSDDAITTVVEHFMSEHQEPSRFASAGGCWPDWGAEYKGRPTYSDRNLLADALRLAHKGRAA